MLEPLPPEQKLEDSDTRSRIIQVATVRFGEQGYESTSLREIAEDLGITKAAVYYHFQSKEDILRAVVEPFLNFFEHNFVAIDQILASEDPLQRWLEAIEELASMIVQARDVMVVVGRNRRVAHETLEDLLNEEGEAHRAYHLQLDQLWLDERIDLSDRVRMACSLAALTGFDDWAPSLLSSMDSQTLVDELTDVVRSILGLNSR